MSIQAMSPFTHRRDFVIFFLDAAQVQHFFQYNLHETTSGLSEL